MPERALDASTEKKGLGPECFVTTHWSVVLAATGPETQKANEALEQLCQTYWYPLYAFVRREGHSEDEAKDLVQGFFARFLERRDFERASPEKGRLRSYLLVSLKNFLANEWQRVRSQKRGGNEVFVAIDAVSAEERIRLEPPELRTPDLAFEQSWARTVLERPFELLREEYLAAGNLRLYELFRPVLADSESPLIEIARTLGMTENAVKQAFFRFRQRYRAALRRQIAQTVGSPEEIEDEMRYLASVLRE